MDFITWPELFLSVIAVISVFVGLSGVMLVVATQLAEEGPWFPLGVLVPIAFAFLGFLIGGAGLVALAVVAGLVALASPVKLAVDRRIDCLPAIATGLGLCAIGAIGVGTAVYMHFAHFVR